MGLLSNIVIGAVENAANQATTAVVLGGLSVVVGAAEVAGQAIATGAKAVAKGYKNVEPGINSVKDAIGSTAKSIHQSYMTSVEENNIKNTFKGKFKNGHTYLINCINKSQRKENIYCYEIYDSNKNCICTAECINSLAKYSVSIVDSDGVRLVQVFRKGLFTPQIYVDPSLESKDPDLLDSIKTYASSFNVISNVTTFKNDDNKAIGYSIPREEYTGGQYLLDVEDVNYLIPLLVQELIRETKTYK